MDGRGVIDLPDRVGDCLEVLRGGLAEAGVEDPGVLAEWLMVEVLGGTRSALVLRQNEPVPRKDCLAGWVTRLAAGEPLQYVLGYTEFMGLRIACDRRALIPRPETEELVDLVLRDAALRGPAAPRVVDVGTGTGCIAIALALACPTLEVWALDVSTEALALAGRNVAAHGLADRVRLVCSDLFDRVTDDRPFDLVVSNPPYVAEGEYRALPRHILGHEPEQALAAGGDGLAILRRLVPAATRRLVSGGGLYLEIGEDQGPAVEALARRAGFRDVTVHLDLAGRVRIVQALNCHV